MRGVRACRKKKSWGREVGGWREAALGMLCCAIDAHTNVEYLVMEGSKLMRRTMRSVIRVAVRRR